MLPQGTLLGRYRVEALAAVGGMGAVYRGTDTLLERAVALKVLPADRAGDPGMAERFACESLQAASLSHPHILPVYDAGEAEGVSYVAMQWIDGMTLEQLVAEEGALEVERAVDYVEAVAGALDHAHDHGIVHRDVKPGNVMVDGGGNAYLMDFGLSVRTDRASGLTRTGEFLATVDYAAPEQIEAGAIDRRADVYGLAAMAFRLMTGRVPFERDSPVARLYAHLNDEPPAAHELRPAVPPAAAETIRRGMAKRPDDRPATAGAFAAELRAALGASPGDTAQLAAVAAAAGSAGEHAARPAARRSRRVLAGAAATVLAAFGGMSLAGITGGGSPTGQVPAADAGARQEQRTTAGTSPTAPATAAADTTAASETSSRADAKKRDRKKRGKDRDKGERDERTAGEERGVERQTPSGAPASAPAPAPQPGPSASSPGQPASSAPSGTQTTPSAPSQTTSTQPAATTPTETTPAETTPTQTTPAQTTPTETTSSDPSAGG